MKTVYFVRHGETLFNKEKRLQGWNDSPLSENGLAHAHSVAQVVKDLGVRQAWISPLGRARQTADIICSANEIDGEIEPNLKEVSFGDFEGKTLPELDELFPGLWMQRQADKWHFRPPNGEANKDAVERARNVLARIETYNGEAPLLIVAHFAINRILLSLLVGIPPVDTVRVSVPHGVVYRAQCENGKWKASYLDTEQKEIGFQDGWLWQLDPAKPMGG